MHQDQATTRGRTNGPTWGDRLLGVAPFLTLCGGLGLLANVALSFEEPHGGLLVGCALLLPVAPLALVVHLLFTRALTPEEKRRWRSALTSRRAAEWFGSYFAPASRRRATDAMVSDGIAAIVARRLP